MTPWQEWRTILLRQQWEMDVLRRAFNAEVEDIIRARIAERERYDVYTYLQIRDDIQALFARYYARYPGDEAGHFVGLLYELIRWVAPMPGNRISRLVRR